LNCIGLGHKQPSWGHIGTMLDQLVPCCAMLGHLGANLSRLRVLFGHLGAILPYWTHLGGYLGAMLGHLGIILGSSWDHLGHLGQSSVRVGGFWGP
jgi:hypothetical protein